MRSVKILIRIIKSVESAMNIFEHQYGGGDCSFSSGSFDNSSTKEGK